MRRTFAVILLALLPACGGSDSDGTTANGGEGGADSGGQGGAGGVAKDGGRLCEPGREACPCYGNGTCDDGLSCASNLCVRLSTGQDGAVAAGGSAGAEAGSGGSGGAGDAGESRCSAGVDCSSSGASICDPDDLACVPGECDVAAQDCSGADGTDFCLSQHGLVNGPGACYDTCTGLGADCGPDRECMPLTDEENEWYCLYRGASAVGVSCTTDSTSTGCVAGHGCATADSGVTYSCYEMCAFWSATPPSCSLAGYRCGLGGLCDSFTGDGAPPGSPCSTPEYTYCGAFGDAFIGMCVTGTALAPVCRLFCRLDPFFDDCSAIPGTTCQDVGVSVTTGACL